MQQDIISHVLKYDIILLLVVVGGEGGHLITFSSQKNVPNIAKKIGKKEGKLMKNSLL